MPDCSGGRCWLRHSVGVQLGQHNHTGAGAPPSSSRSAPRSGRSATTTRRYEELRADPDKWASYQAEARLTDNVAGDGLLAACAEYPEPPR